MTWSIYKDTSGEYDQWEPCYVAWFVDYDVDTTHTPNQVKFLHDGYVDVHFDGNRITCKVVDGRWAPETHQDILEMVKETYWGSFVEGFYRKNGRIFVSIGS